MTFRWLQLPATGTTGARRKLAHGLAALLLLAAFPVHAESFCQKIRSFGFPDQLGLTPQSGLVIGLDGALYGTTYAGGLASGGNGVVYRVEPDGSGYHVLHVFAGGTNGAAPMAALLSAGNVLYGTTSAGGLSQGGLVAQGGVLFQVNTDGTGFAVLHAFGGPDDGASPRARLIAGEDGALYGTTYAGGTAHFGTVFKINPTGSGYSVLHHFLGGTDGSYPAAGLVRGSDGGLYGVTQYGGNTNRLGYGTLFRLNENGSDYAVIYAFGGTNGSQPLGDLVRGSNATLLGTTFLGGAHSSGTVFSINEGGAGFTTLYDFGASVSDGSNPTAALLPGADGFLYGTTASGNPEKTGTAFKLQPNGSNYVVLAQFAGHSFANQQAIPELIFGADGGLYGTKPGGGSEGYGVVYKLSADGVLFTNLHSFSQHGGDARSSGATLLRAADGWLYGAAPGGGAYNGGALYRFAQDGSNYALIHSFVTNQGASPSQLLEALPGVLFGTASSGGQSNMGTLFRVNTDGSDFSVLHHFTGGPADGQRPLGGLLLAHDGALYGTTIYGGVAFGTIYRLTPDGMDFHVVYSFANSGDGLLPICWLVQGNDDALYGTTDAGGAYSRGSVFKVNTDGSGFTVLHHFASNASDGGGFSQSGLLLGPDGALYGVTAAGSSGPGCVFRLTQDGNQYDVLHLFADSDGWNPQGQLILGADGALYGATQFGGTFGGQGGVVFKLDTDGNGFAVLHSFAFPVGPEGARPTCGLVLGTGGSLFGVTPLGGDFSDGVLFRVDPVTPTNNPPTLVSALGNAQSYIFTPFSYTVPAGTFFDRDWGETLAYSVSAPPPGLSFDPATLIISGAPTAAGNWTMTVTATDNGSPSALSASNTFQISVLIPDIALEPQGYNMLISWPDDAMHFQIQETSDLASGTNWTSLGLPGGYTIGSRRYTTVPWRPGRWFYRLKGPY